MICMINENRAFCINRRDNRSASKATKGAMVTAVIVSVLKPARPVEAESEDEELKVDFDIEIG